MTKSEFINQIADHMGCTRAEAVRFMEAFQDTVIAQVKKGETITLTNFCKFSRKDVPARKARKGTNPFTGEEMTFKAKPASKSVKITPLKGLKEAVSSKKR